MRGFAVLSLLALAACAGRDGLAADQRPSAIETELAGYAARGTEDCLPTSYDQVAGRVVDPSHIVYTRTRSEKWVNTLDAPCPGLRPQNTLLVEQFGSRVCRLDPVRDLGTQPTFIAGPRCPLGAFTRYELTR